MLIQYLFISCSDKEPPILRCFNGSSVAYANEYLNRNKYTFFYPFEEISDNSGQIVSLICDPPRNSNKEIGTTISTCTAYDDAGNYATCEAISEVKGKNNSSIFKN